MILISIIVAAAENGVIGSNGDLPWRLSLGGTNPLFAPFTPPTDGLYGILPDHTLLHAALGAGLRCVQLRHKHPDSVQTLQTQLDASLADAAQAGAQLFINDHWRAALALPPRMAAEPGFRLGIHLGQEDLQALSTDDRARLLAERDRVMLGLSSHSLWELARAAGCGATHRYRAGCRLRIRGRQAHALCLKWRAIRSG